jgi:hypothetical protein
MASTTRRGLARGDSGQSMMEFAIILPILVVLALGVIETSHALLNQHVVTKLTREGSNLISRDTTLQDAAAAMRVMAQAPVDFTTNSTVIFTVLKRGATTGTANFDRLIVYQRHQSGTLSVSSQIHTAGGGSFGGAPNYEANNSDGDTGLRVTNLPTDLIDVRGAMLYVTEIYTDHTLITPFDRFGVSIPRRLYSIAYF